MTPPTDSQPLGPVPLLDLQRTWIVVCKHSREFGDREVNAVKRQFDKASRGRFQFHCLTDRPSQDWHIPLVKNLPGWWSILESFRVVGPALLTGLDTLLVGDLGPLLDIAEACPENTLYGIRDFYRPSRWASGVTIWNGDWSGLLKAFTPAHMRKFRGNQDYTEYAVRHMQSEIGKEGSLAYLQDHVDGIISYKRDIRDRKPRFRSLPEATRICCFHGVPRPWNALKDDPWIAEYLGLEVSAQLPINNEEHVSSRVVAAGGKTDAGQCEA